MPKKKQRPKLPARPPQPPVEALPVAWMLAVMTALVCELGCASARAWLRLVNPAAEPIRVLAVILLFAALVVGLIALGLQWAVQRTARIKPPRGIHVFAAVVGTIPLVVLVVRLLTSNGPAPL